MKRAVAVAGVLAVATVLVPRVADAHSMIDCSTASGTCHHAYVFNEGSVTVVKRATFSGLSAQWQDRLADATVAWPTSTGRPTLSVTSSSLSVSGWCSQGPGVFLARVNVARAETAEYNSDPGVLATTCVFVNPNPNIAPFRWWIERSDLIIDPDVGEPGQAGSTCSGGSWQWWTGASAPPVNSIGGDGKTICYIDAYGTLVHEMAHALGFAGHFSSGDPVCFPVTSGIQTMCSIISVNTGWLRTPAGHDIDVQDQGYWP